MTQGVNAFFFFFNKLGVCFVQNSGFIRRWRNTSVSSLRKDHILHHVSMSGQVLVKPAHITRWPPKVTSKSQPPCGSYTLFYCSAQTSPQLSLLCSGEEIMAHNWYSELSVTRSTPRYCTLQTQGSFVLYVPSLHTVQYFLGKYFEAQAKCNNWKVIPGYQCWWVPNKAPLRTDITECGHKRISLQKAPSSAL